jgi:choline-glycine betaine transporter
MLIYQLDELGIFLAAVFTFKAGKLEEKHGRVLKLIGGMLMLTLAIVMLVNPHLLSDLSNSLLIFALAFGATGLVLLLHRVVLPRMGVQIGSEQMKTISQRQAAKSKREGAKSSKPAAKQKRSDGK